MNDPRPNFDSFHNPLLRGVVLLCVLVTIGLIFKNGCSHTGPIRFYTASNPIPADNAGRELVQVMSYLAACFAALGLAIFAPRRRWFFVAYSLYFALFVLEETDWLQQILNYPTPAFFAEYSTKNVVNLHNLNLLGDPANSVAGVLLSRLLLAAPGVAFGVWAIWRAIRGDFLGKAPLVALAIVFVLDFFPRHSVFQLLFGFFAVAYPVIVWMVDFERAADAEPPPGSAPNPDPKP